MATTTASLNVEATCTVELSNMFCPGLTSRMNTCDPLSTSLGVFISLCTECPPFFYGVDCLTSCDCVVDNTESCDNINGTCYCSSGWTNTSCHTRIPVDE
ncbi:hypothetical protein BaRGS_00031756, partial [Batillaria attramentaria]